VKVSISGIRGIFGVDFGLYDVSRFSRLFGSYINNTSEQLSCIVGRDSRPSGKIISDLVTACLLEQGINVYDLDIAPTPVLFREARKAGGAIMVTASHNPLEWNGLKMLIKGRGLYEEELGNILNNSFTETKKPGKYYKINSTYIDDLLNFNPASRLQQDFKVGFDCGGGAACNYVHKLFEAYKIKYLGINDAFGFSSRGPDPTSDPLDELTELVKLNELNFGFAFDMDGDRLVIVDRREGKLHPDLTLLLCVSGAISNNTKKFVISLDTSVSVEKYIKRQGGQVIYSKVGESNVIKKMTEVKGEAGGEGSSGGFIVPSFSSCRDGLLASITVCSLDQQMIKDCLNLASGFKQIRTKLPIRPEINLDGLLEKIFLAVKPYSSEVISDDGFKFIFDDNAWVLVRSSNTEHVLRISMEAKRTEIDSLYKLIYGKIYEVYEKT
jgi:phosphomannomutase